MTTSIRINDDLRDWLMDHRSSKLKGASDVLQNLIEFKEKHIDFSEAELNLIFCAVDKLDCSACILDCDEKDGQYALCGEILQKIER